MDIKINASWFRFLEELPADEIKKIVHAIWDYAQGNQVENIKSAAWETIKASIDCETQHKKEISENRRKSANCRWHKTKELSEQSAPETQTEVIEPEIIVPENKFISLTDNLEIRTALGNPDSAISVFLETGARYDELSTAEREFVDRAGVREKCAWHKEIQAATKTIKTKIPTEEEVLEYARQQNSIAGMGGFACSDEEALNFYDYYSGIGWVMPNDARTPIINWKPFLRKWIRNPLRQQKPGSPKMTFKEMKQLENDIKIQKILNGEL